MATIQITAPYVTLKLEGTVRGFYRGAVIDEVDTKDARRLIGKGMAKRFVPVKAEAPTGDAPKTDEKPPTAPAPDKGAKPDEKPPTAPAPDKGAKPDEKQS